MKSKKKNQSKPQAGTRFPTTGCTITDTTAWLWFRPLAFESIPMLTDVCQGEGNTLRGNYWFARPTNELFGSSGSTGSAPRAAQPLLPIGSSSPQQSSPALLLPQPAWTLPSRSPNLPRSHGGSSRLLPSKPSPCLTCLELPSAAGPVQPPALRGAWAMSTAAEGDLHIVLGTQRAKDAISRKLCLFFFFFFPFQPSLGYFLFLSFC